VAKPNYSFEKRQRELEKKKKKEEKHQRKLTRGTGSDQAAEELQPETAVTADADMAGEKP